MKKTIKKFITLLLTVLTIVTCDEVILASTTAGQEMRTQVLYLTDIITDKNRHDSIICAIRTLSPDYIFCDEIADSSDAAAIRDGVGCGVKFIATLHAENMDDLISRKFSRELLEAGYFEKAVFLSRQGWKIKEIRSIINVC